MVMDLIQQNFKSTVTPHAAITALRSPQKHIKSMPRAHKPLELTRDNQFVDGDQDIFDVLARQEADKQGLERSIGSTIALLKRSSMMLQDAEATIEEQTQRIENLEKISTIDEASGLLNRRGFAKIFTKEVARTNRGVNDGGLLVMFNLENLHVIRKEHGKEAAHMAIRLITKALESEIRDTDHAGRILDDEFVLLFTDASMEVALTRLQNMALRLNKLSLIWDGMEINVNLSLGLKSFGANERAERIFEAASDDLERNRKGAAKSEKRA
jgi:diguanylate cyclase (GGDEF)-like protein